MSLLIEMMFTFMKIGAFSFGGGYAMIPLFQKELVGHGWTLISEVADVVAISEMTPGPFAVNAATFAGTKMMGLPGALFATFGVVLPSVVITLIVARYFFGFQNKQSVQSVLWGIRPAVTGMIMAAAMTIASASFFGIQHGANFGAIVGALSKVDWVSLAIAAVAFVAMYRFKASPVLMVFACAGVGVLLYALFPGIM